MWAPEVSHGDMALLRLPMGLFGDGTSRAARSDYQALPGSTQSGIINANRFVGGWAMYAISRYEAGYRSRRISELVAVPVAGSDDQTALRAGYTTGSGLSSIQAPYIVCVGRVKHMPPGGRIGRHTRSESSTTRRSQRRGKQCRLS